MNYDIVFLDILDNESITTVFQPIVSLEDGSIFAYEALSRISMPCCELNIEQLFHLAYKKNKLWELEKLCRKKSLQNAQLQPSGTLLFINVDPNIIHDSDFKTGFTSKKLQEYEMAAQNIVFEINEKSAIEDMNIFVSSVQHYQKQEFKIAIDDFGSGYSGLNRVCSFAPEYLKIDMNLIRNIDTDKVRKSAVAATVDFCKKTGIKVIAEGIETQAELKSLIRMGIPYGQGYYLGKPNETFIQMDQDKKLEIKNTFHKTKPGYPLSFFAEIAGLGSKKTAAHLKDSMFKIYEAMEKDIETTEFFVVDDNNNICGILTQNYVYKKFSGQFGYTLSKRVCAKNMMDPDFLSVDEHSPIDKVAEMAMNRTYDHVYDAIAVTSNGKYLCTVTVKDLLLSSIQTQLKLATDANPLTGLPGNQQIQQTIGTTFVKNRPWAIIYLDIDNFKAYNDAYGFSNGDLMILAVAQAMDQCCTDSDFMGHIGGDDFVIVSSSQNVEKLCQNICDCFKNIIKPLYSPFDWEQGIILSKNRNGFTQNFAIASLSIAVVTNKTSAPASIEELSKIIAETKKIAKQREGNAIVVA